MTLIRRLTACFWHSRRCNIVGAKLHKFRYDKTTKWWRFDNNERKNDPIPISRQHFANFPATFLERLYTVRQPVSGTALRTIQFGPILLTSVMRDVKVIAILLQSQRLFPSNRNHVNVCHGGNAEVWLELYTGHSSARNRLSNGTKMGHICHSELRGIMS